VVVLLELDVAVSSSVSKPKPHKDEIDETAETVTAGAWRWYLLWYLLLNPGGGERVSS